MFSSFCDDFYLDMCINTELDLPNERDTILAFFERIQKQFPSMGNFYRRENDQYCLEGDQKKGQCSAAVWAWWVSTRNDPQSAIKIITAMQIPKVLFRLLRRLSIIEIIILSPP